MSDPVLILILAPLSVGLILMFLAQVARNHKIENRADVLAARVDKLERAASEAKRTHNEEISRLREENALAIQRQDKEIEGIKVMSDFYKKTGDSSTLLVSQLIETLEKCRK